MLSSSEEIKSRLDIVDVLGGYLKLHKAGANFKALCPFHRENTSSFFVSPSRQIWHCFGCGEGGDMFTFIMRIEGVEFGEALKILGDKAGVKLRKQDPALTSARNTCYGILEEATRFYEDELGSGENGASVRAYLIKRGLSDSTIKEFRLGYALPVWRTLFAHLTELGYKSEDIERAGLIIKKEGSRNDYYDRFRNRIMFPIAAIGGKVIGFTGRIFDEGEGGSADPQDLAKYVNTPQTIVYDKGKVLYGLHKSGIEIRKADICIAVEGNMDFLMSWQAGVKNVVASSGTALSSSQLTIIKRYTENILFAFDRDIAGQEATKRGIEEAESLGFTIKVLPLGGGKDPADIILASSEEWQKNLKEARSIYDFYFEHACSLFDAGTVEGKKKITKLLLPVLLRIPNKVEEAHWVSRLASKLHMPDHYLFEELRKVRATAGNTVSSREFSLPEPLPPSKKTRHQMLEERLVILLLRHPEKQAELTKEDLDLLSENTKGMIKFLKEEYARDTGNSAPEELKEMLAYLDLYADFEKIQHINPDDEFVLCRRELKIMQYKEQLDSLTGLIKAAEAGADEDRLNTLLTQFKEVSEVLHKEIPIYVVKEA